jgi:hypothetical protein
MYDESMPGKEPELRVCVFQVEVRRYTLACYNDGDIVVLGEHFCNR